MVIRAPAEVSYLMNLPFVLPGLVGPGLVERNPASHVPIGSNRAGTRAWSGEPGCATRLLGDAAVSACGRDLVGDGRSSKSAACCGRRRSRSIMIVSIV